MKHSGHAFGMVMGVALLSAACGPASEVEVDVGDPGLEAMDDKPGSGDPNGAPKVGYHNWKDEIVIALGGPLLQNGQINPAIVATGIFNDPAGEESFDHAFRCAVAAGTIVTHEHNGELHAYEGQGMVSGASLWTGQGLSPSVVDNVMECVIAFVNDKTDGVNILLTGPNVNDDGEGHTAFIHSEALWCAHTTSFGGVTIDVYPTRAFVRGCGIDAKTALEQRVCWQVGTCGLNYQGILELSAECQEVGTPGNGQYECNGKACTMTWLEDLDPDWCDPPPPPSQ